jgi:hypothetical protein
VLAPGASTTLQCRWDTAGLRGRSRSTFSVYYARLTSDGKMSALQRLPLAVQGEVQPTFDVTPPKLHFESDQSSTHVVELAVRPGAAAVSVESAYCTHAAFRVVSQTATRLEVQFTPEEWPEGVRLSPELRVRTDCPTDREIHIPLRVDGTAAVGRGPSDSLTLTSGGNR